jgi:UDP-N-acetylglucosamine--N-acetylmuramyl-(pentapeptide) pyrophosphoryl-undecaprenol N-acetylglucosamine transferase
MTHDRCILLAAGGTGGHLFPAEALANELARRGVAVELVTDDRALRYGAQFPARAVHAITSATPTGGSMISKATAIAKLAVGAWQARKLIKRLKPACVVGFGGYPTAPPIVAASMLGAPAILHEQNAVMGRANRFLASRVKRIATGFKRLDGVSAEISGKAVHTGNPVRPAVIAASEMAYPDFGADGVLRILVTGGSQGARVMADIVPAGVAALPGDLRARVKIVQQARGEDEARVRDAYAQLGVEAEVAPFFKDLPQRIAGAHFVISRAGASTVCELAVIGRPAILVPYPFALDQDQAANAAELAESGAVTVIRQDDFTPERLAHEVSAVFADPEGLTRRAAAAKSAGVPDAAARLADLVMATAELG